jgi:TnpA family transposase
LNRANIQTANNSIIGLIDKLALANAFRAIDGELHTGSDGRKINVAVDSLHASYSFKYFGKGKGVTLYTFLDERQTLFYSTVITSSDRDAPYVIDGLLNNDVIKSSIHSTDTHGFTEAVFAVAHFMGTAFAPRIKKIGKQKLYTLGSVNDYKKKGYKILPSRAINQQLLRDNWDDLLRFMVSVKLKHATASQLFKRLSSYAKDHPLYQALKEFGRIMKSIFILTYLDDMELRQRIQKQLNKVELSNKFSKAIFFANNQEFKCGTQDEQEIAAACSVLIQNAIVLWNYLTVSQCLAGIKDIVERNKIVILIKQSSMMTWGHMNMGGEYDFSLPFNQDNPFDMEEILELKLQAA